jgi:hypothetical protein
VYGNCNAPPAVAYSAIIYALRCMVTRDVPLNQVRACGFGEAGGKGGREDWRESGSCHAPVSAAAHGAPLPHCAPLPPPAPRARHQGCLAPIKVVIPPQCLLNPSPEAAVVGGNVLTSQRVTDVVLKAFGAAAASQVRALDAARGAARGTRSAAAASEPAQTGRAPSCRRPGPARGRPCLPPSSLTCPDPVPVPPPPTPRAA